jgi:hypothetical protein
MVITDDHGGDLTVYIERFEQLKQRRERVVIAGKCYSACTIFLGYPRVCVELNAELGFHSAYMRLDHGTFPDDWATELMRGYYPKDVKVKLPVDGLFVIRGRQLPLRFRCR